MTAAATCKMRSMQQVRSLPIKKKGHGWINRCLEGAGNETHAPSPNPQPAHKKSGTIEKDSDPIRHNVTAVCNHVESDCGYLIRNGPHCNTCAILEYFRLEGCLGGASNQMHAPIPQGWGTTIGPRLRQWVPPGTLNGRNAPSPQPAHQNKHGLEPTVGSRFAH